MEVIKILGQASPASTSTTIYTVPVDKGCVISHLNICNRDNYDATVSVQVGSDNHITSNPELTWVEKDLDLFGKAATQVCKGVTLAQGDRIKVTSSSEHITFVLFGSEFDQTFEYNT